MTSPPRPTRPPGEAPSPREMEDLKAATRAQIARRDDRLSQVDQLITAAGRLAATIAATEELAQQRADLLKGRLTTRHRHRDGRSMISLSHAAQRSGRHPEVLRRWCAEGRIPAVRIGRTWAITPETLALLLSHSARSRPRFPTPERP